jgi:hypothetical protein
MLKNVHNQLAYDAWGTYEIASSLAFWTPNPPK